jgi:hypothetical protein
MSYTVYIKETNSTSVTFDTKEEAEHWMAEPDFDLIGDWYTDDFEMNLEEDTL